MSTSHRRPTPTLKRPRRRAPGIVLDPPPAYLSVLPTSALAKGTQSGQGDRRADQRILDGLRKRGIYARPTLAEVEAERALRGVRPGLTVAEHPSGVDRLVLPMGPGVSPERAAWLDPHRAARAA